MPHAINLDKELHIYLHLSLLLTANCWQDKTWVKDLDGEQPCRTACCPKDNPHEYHNSHALKTICAWYSVRFRRDLSSAYRNTVLLAPQLVFGFLMGLLIFRVILDGRYQYLPIFIFGAVYANWILPSQIPTTNELSVTYLTAYGLGLGTDIFLRLPKRYSAKLVITKK
jgi:hypothetical protein